MRRWLLRAAAALASIVGMAGCEAVGSAELDVVTVSETAPDGYRDRILARWEPGKPGRSWDFAGEYAVFRAAFPDMTPAQAEEAGASGIGRLYVSDQPRHYFPGRLRRVAGTEPPTFEFYVPRDPERMLVRAEWDGHNFVKGWSPQVVANGELCVEFIFELAARTRFRDTTAKPIPAADFFRQGEPI